MSAHTPGPWTYSKCRCGHPVCSRYNIGHSGANGMFDEADAKLIAAAPDLFEALRDMAGRFTDITEDDVVSKKQAEAALAKAGL